jgi:hypothetical protein
VKTTFHIAASPSARRVHDLQSFLISRRWRWSDGHNALEAPSGDLAVWAVKDLRAALTADVFVMVFDAKTPASVLAKLGARWAMSKPIHAIRRKSGRAPLHANLPGIVWHTSAEEFAQAMFGS